MHRNNIHLHYCYLKYGNKDIRILTTNFKQLVAGNRSSDFFGYFGLGSGEFWTPRIEGLTDGVSTVEIADTDLSLLLWKDHPRFMGFIDAQPEFKPMVILRGGDKSIYELPINWEVYTQLGVKTFARTTLGAFRRGWIAYETPEENQDRVDDIIRMMEMF